MVAEFGFKIMNTDRGEDFQTKVIYQTEDSRACMRPEHVVKQNSKGPMFGPIKQNNHGTQPGSSSWQHPHS